MVILFFSVLELKHGVTAWQGIHNTGNTVHICRVKKSAFVTWLVG